MPLWSVIVLSGLGFGLLMLLVIYLIARNAPTEEELWPGEERRRADALEDRRKNPDPIARRQGLRIVRH